MADSDFLKCSCQKCGGRIEFPVTGVGSTVDCPHCGAQTKLLSDSSGSNIPPATNKLKPALLLALGVLILVLVSGTLIVGFYLPKRQKQTAMPPTKAAVQVQSPQESAPLPSDGINDFKIGKISLQKTEGSGLVYAVGTIKNTIDQQRFGVKVELNLLDEQDQKIGVASDYVSVIEARKEWQFKALLTQPKTVKVTVADIKEQ